MRRRISILGSAALLPVGAVRPQVSGPNEAGVAMGHVHLVVQDGEAGMKFWTILGGTPTKLSANEPLKFPGVLILLRKGGPSGGSVGSVVNHMGFMVQNIQESMDKWKAAGLETEPGSSARQGYVTTPDGLVRIEILENTSLSVPIAFDYIYFEVADTGTAGKPTMSEMQAWYAKIFGGTPGKRGQRIAMPLFQEIHLLEQDNDLTVLSGS